MTTSGSPTTVASVRGVDKTFGERAASVRALRSVDLDVRRGEVLLLAGPSGSGKTTLLSILGCILSPSSGDVQVCGQDVTRLGRKELARIRLRQIGFVYQDINLLPTLSAIENVEMPLLLAGKSRKESRASARKALEFVGLGVKEHAFPADLSGGEKQRVAITRALIHNPELVLADEPTASLDSANARVILGVLRDLGMRHRCGVVIVSHDPRASAFADRTVYLEDGRISATPVGLHPFMAQDFTRAPDGP